MCFYFLLHRKHKTVVEKAPGAAERTPPHRKGVWECRIFNLTKFDFTKPMLHVVNVHTMIIWWISNAAESIRLQMWVKEPHQPKRSLYITAVSTDIWTVKNQKEECEDRKGNGPWRLPMSSPRVVGASAVDAFVRTYTHNHGVERSSWEDKRASFEKQYLSK